MAMMAISISLGIPPRMMMLLTVCVLSIVGMTQATRKVFNAERCNTNANNVENWNPTWDVFNHRPPAKVRFGHKPGSKIPVVPVDVLFSNLQDDTYEFGAIIFEAGTTVSFEDGAEWEVAPELLRGGAKAVDVHFIGGQTPKKDSVECDISCHSNWLVHDDDDGAAANGSMAVVATNVPCAKDIAVFPSGFHYKLNANGIHMYDELEFAGDDNIILNTIAQTQMYPGPKDFYVGSAGREACRRDRGQICVCPASSCRRPEDSAIIAADLRKLRQGSREVAEKWLSDRKRTEPLTDAIVFSANISIVVTTQHQVQTIDFFECITVQRLSQKINTTLENGGAGLSDASDKAWPLFDMFDVDVDDVCTQTTTPTLAPTTSSPTTNPPSQSPSTSPTPTTATATTTTTTTTLTTVTTMITTADLNTTIENVTTEYNNLSSVATTVAQTTSAITPTDSQTLTFSDTNTNTNTSIDTTPTPTPLSSSTSSSSSPSSPTTITPPTTTTPTTFGACTVSVGVSGSLSADLMSIENQVQGNIIVGVPELNTPSDQAAASLVVAAMTDVLSDCTTAGGSNNNNGDDDGGGEGGGADDDTDGGGGGGGGESFPHVSEMTVSYINKTVVLWGGLPQADLYLMTNTANAQRLTHHLVQGVTQRTRIINVDTVAMATTFVIAELIGDNLDLALQTRQLEQQHQHQRHRRTTGVATKYLHANLTFDVVGGMTTEEWIDVVMVLNSLVATYESVVPRCFTLATDLDQQCVDDILFNLGLQLYDLGSESQSTIETELKTRYLEIRGCTLYELSMATCDPNAFDTIAKQRVRNISQAAKREVERWTRSPTSSFPTLSPSFTLAPTLPPTVTPSPPSPTIVSLAATDASGVSWTLVGVVTAVVIIFTLIILVVCYVRHKRSVHNSKLVVRIGAAHENPLYGSPQGLANYLNMEENPHLISDDGTAQPTLDRNISQQTGYLYVVDSSDDENDNDNNNNDDNAANEEEYAMVLDDVDVDGDTGIYGDTEVGVPETTLSATDEQDVYTLATNATDQPSRAYSLATTETAHNPEEQEGFYSEHTMGAHDGDGGVYGHEESATVYDGNGVYSVDTLHHQDESEHGFVVPIAITAGNGDQSQFVYDLSGNTEESETAEGFYDETTTAGFVDEGDDDC